MIILFRTSLFIILLFLQSCIKNTETSEFVSLKNVVVIVGDDHAISALGCYGNEKISTPNLDELATEGVVFTRAYANAPMCSASRQSMLTGKYPHTTGVTLLTTSFPEENITIAEHLKGVGFSTGIIGKDHFNNNLNHGFDMKLGRRDWMEIAKTQVPDSIDVLPTWKPFRDPAAIWLNSMTYPAPYYDEDMSGTFYAKKASEFIEKNQDGQFILWLAFHEPHSPFHFPVEQTGIYNQLSLDLPEMGEEDKKWMPEVFKDLSDAEKKGIIKSYYTSVTHLDKNIGLVLDKIKELDLDEETLIIYLGDHGYLLGDHGRFEKHMMWEEAIRAPLIIKAGKATPRSFESDVLTEFIDISATITDALNIDKMQDSQGKSLWPVVIKETNHHKDTVFAEFLIDNKAMVCTKEWKYIYSSGKRDLGQGYATGNPPMGVSHRLYNLASDPLETRDVSNDPNNQRLLKKLQNSMIATFMRTHPKANELPDGLSMEEKLTWFCIPPDLGANLEDK